MANMDIVLCARTTEHYGKMLIDCLDNKTPEIHSEEDREKYKICTFIAKKQHLLFKKLDKSLKIPNNDPLIPVLPIEIFGNLSKQARRKWYFKELNKYDILVGKVINVTLPMTYKILILHQYGKFRKLDDLSLVVHLPKTAKEMDIVNGKLANNDIIRAAIYTCDAIKRTTFVTVNSENIPEEFQKIKLGKISESELPSYIGKTLEGQCLVDVLHHSPHFKNPVWPDELTTCLNVDRHKVYSLHEKFDGIEFAPADCAPGLRERQNRKTSDALLLKAIDGYSEGDVVNSLPLFHKAIQINPENIEALYRRGVVYANENNLRKAIMDLENVLKIDNNHTNAREVLSRLLVTAAKAHKDQNNILAANEALTVAMRLNSENSEAASILDEWQEEDHALKDLKEKSIDALEEDRRKLEEELKMSEISCQASSSNVKKIKSKNSAYHDEHKKKCDRFLEAIRSTDQLRPSKGKHSHHCHRHSSHDRKKKSKEYFLSPRSSGRGSRSESPENI